MDWKLMEELFSSYDTAIVFTNTQEVRFENKNGWFEEHFLTDRIALFILLKGMRVKHETKSW